MSATPPQNDRAGSRSPRGSRSEKPPADEEQQAYYSRFLGWLVLAIIVGYAGLQMPLPWRLLTLAASLFGVVGGVVLFVQSLRRKLSLVVTFGAALVTLSCGLFLLIAGVQVVFWEASDAFDTCVRSAVTERALDRCYSEYEQDVLSLIPGVP